jgi:2-dehydropantoate 2-reductase
VNIHIIGGGAVGLFFAAQWSAHHVVTLRTRTQQQAEQIQSEGIRVIEERIETVYPINSKMIGPVTADLIVVAVKQYHMGEIILLLQNADALSILFIQNGMSHLDLMNELPHKNVYVASVEHGIVKIDERTIQVNGRNKTNIGAYRGGTEKIIEDVQTEGFRFEWREHIHSMLIEKMAANAVINPLTAVLQVKNGEIADNERYRSIAKNLCLEFASVYPYKTEEETFQSVLAICNKTADNESSMLKDMKAGRPTEIDAIIGILLKEAERQDLFVPSFYLLYNMVKGKENTPGLMSK